MSDEPERGVRDLSRDQDPSTGVDVPGSSGDSGAQGAVDAGPCGDLQASARALVESHRSCALDEDCRDEAIAVFCPASVGCDVFVRKDTDLLWTALAEVEAKYRACGGNCPPTKTCGKREVTRAYCDGSKHCAARALPASSADAAIPSAPREGGPSSDASRGDAGSSDAGSVTPGADAQTDAGGGAASQFACEVNLDCVVTNVGNCCGYYPRCANVNATFVPPSCTGGQAGVCGFPSIHSCECRQNTCVSLQGGKPI